MPEPITLYLIFGCLAGLLSGLFGIGGGAILVPFLAWEFTSQGFSPELVMIMAVATSLATIIITSLASVYAHHRMGAVHWRAVFLLTPGILIGSLMGSVIADHLPVMVLKFIFASFLLLISLRMFRSEKGAIRQYWEVTRGLFFSAGTLIGVLSTIVGIGGGSLSVPFLTKCQFPMRNAVAISSACGFPIALMGTATYMVLGWKKVELPLGSWGYVFMPAFAGIVVTSILFAPVGAKIANILPTVRLKKIFALMLFTIGLKLFWQACNG